MATPRSEVRVVGAPHGALDAPAQRIVGRIWLFCREFDGFEGPRSVALLEEREERIWFALGWI